MTEWLLDTLIATSALMLLVLLLREPVRRHFGARAAYALWLIPAARAVMPPLVREVERVPVAIAPTPALDVLPMSAAVSARAVEAPYDPLVAVGGWPGVLVALWLAGAAVLLIGHAFSYRAARRSILATAVHDGRVGRIAILRSWRVKGPMAFGLLRPVVALPDDFETRFGPAERRSALAHELSHHRSGDLFANLFAFVLLSLQWFNPLAWASYRSFRLDQEAACDARVLDEIEDPAAYGSAIAKAASGRAFFFAGTLESSANLKWRLKQMKTIRNAPRRLFASVGILGIGALLMPATATQAVRYVTGDAVEVERDRLEADIAWAETEVERAEQAIEQSAEAIEVGQIEDEEGVRIVRLSDERSGPAKAWSDMTAEQRAEMDEELAELREALVELREERGEVRLEIREAREELERDRPSMEAELAQARAEIEEAIRDIDEDAAKLRAHGKDPEAIKMGLRASLAGIEAIDPAQIARTAIEAIDPEAIDAQMAAAEAKVAARIRELEARRR